MPPWSSRTSPAERLNGSSHGSNGNGSNSLRHVELPLLSPLTVLPSAENRIRRILRLIESGPARSIHELAEELNLSDSHLQHLFKQHTGVQLGHFLLEQRLMKAASLLENTRLSVKEVAAMVGYEHPSSFIRAFERRFAVAPRGYRLQNDRRNS